MKFLKSFLFLVGVIGGLGLLNSSLSADIESKSNSYFSHDTLTHIPLVDHHTHIFTPTIREHLVSTIDKLDTLPPLGLKQLINTLDKDSVQKAAVLSNAYFFSKSGATTQKDFNTVQEQNDKIAEAVATYPKKLVGFFSINPLSDSALVEIKRNADKKEFAGIKLHLANSKVDLRNAKHVDKLAKVFGQANRHGLGIVVHLRTTNKAYGRKDAETFIQEVLSEAPDIPVQIAHMAGWSGYDPATHAALSTFSKYSRKGDISDNIYFDISAVVRNARVKRDSTTPGWYPEKRYHMLAKQMRKIGISRILFGSDWPEWRPRDYQTDIIEQLPLTKGELRTLFSNRAPWFTES